jgi:hypothetical protein
MPKTTHQKNCLKLALCCLVAIIALFLMGCATWSKTDKALLTTFWLSTGADYATTKNALDDGGRELNPLIGKHPSDGKLLGYMIITNSAVTAIAHFVPPLRKWLLGGGTVVHGFCAVHNAGEK